MEGELGLPFGDRSSGTEPLPTFESTVGRDEWRESGQRLTGERECTTSLML